jgi:hypothetical protein
MTDEKKETTPQKLHQEIEDLKARARADAEAAAEATPPTPADDPQASVPPPQPETPQDEPAAPPAPETPAAPPSPTRTPLPTQGRDAPGPDNYEQRYRVLQGKYNKETADMRQRLDTLERENAELRDQVAAAPQAATELTEEELLKLGVTEEDVQAYGIGVFNALDKLAAQRVANALKPIQESMVQSDEDRFFDTLARMEPDAQRLSNDDMFLAWLDEGNGVRRRIIEEAYMIHDAPFVAQMFKEYKGELQSPDRSPQPSVSGQVYPARDAAIPPPESPKPKERTYTVAEVKEFYDNITKRRYSTEDARKLSAELSRAIREGRVISPAA